MTTMSRTARGSACLVVLSLAGGCAAARMALPAGQTTGYELRSGDRVVGAVEVIGGGAVRLRPELGATERAVLAATAAALLLLEDLRATLEDGP